MDNSGEKIGPEGMMDMDPGNKNSVCSWKIGTLGFGHPGEEKKL